MNINMNIVVIIMVFIWFIAGVIVNNILHLGGWGLLIMWGVIAILYNIYIFLEKEQDKENKE